MLKVETLTKATDFQREALGTGADRYIYAGWNSVKADSARGETLYEAKAVVNEKCSYYLNRGGRHMQEIVTRRTTTQFANYLNVIEASEKYTELVLAINNEKAIDYFVGIAEQVGFTFNVNFFIVIS